MTTTPFRASIDLTAAQIERRKLALLQAASRLVNPIPLHSGNPRDTAKSIADAVKTARAVLSEIDKATEQEI